MTDRLRPMSAPDLAQAEPARAGDRVRLFALAALTVVLIGLCILLAVPFLPAITWGVALAILAWPMHRWISRRVAQPRARRRAQYGRRGGRDPGRRACSSPTRSPARPSRRRAGEGRSGRGRVLRRRRPRSPSWAGAVAWMERLGLDVETEARTAHRVAHPGRAPTSPRGRRWRSSSSWWRCSSSTTCSATVGVPDRAPRPAAAVEGRERLPLRRAADSVHATLYATVVTSLIDATASASCSGRWACPPPCCGPWSCSS